MHVAWSCSGLDDDTQEEMDKHLDHKEMREWWQAGYDAECFWSIWGYYQHLR